MLQSNNSPNSNRSKILQRLQELSQWQAEQTRRLNLRQDKQRQELGNEHKNMYKVLGFEHPKKLEASKNINNERPECYETVTNTNNEICQRENISGDEKNIEPSENNEVLKAQPDCQHALLSPLKLHKAKKTVNPDELKTQEKKPFLRKGDGIRQRFKIDPDAFSITKLPTYKYAKTSTKFMHKRPSGIVTKTKLNTKKKISSHLPAAPPSSKTDFDINEVRFQQKLISTDNMFNSTPDIKTSFGSSVHHGSQQKLQINCKDGKKLNEERVNNEIKPISWSKVLDSQQIKPISVGDLRQREFGNYNLNEDDNLSVFELLERKAQDGSIDMNSSYIRVFLNKKTEKKVTNNDDPNVIPIKEALKEAGIKPFVKNTILGTEDEDEDQDNDLVNCTDDEQVVEMPENDMPMLEDDDYDNCSEMAIPKYNLNETCENDEHLANESTISSTTTIEKCQRLRVRFSDTNSTCEYKRDSDSNTPENSINTEQPSNLGLLANLKNSLYQIILQRRNKDNDTTDVSYDTRTSIAEPENTANTSDSLKQISPITSEEILAKSNLLKLRLNELELEIKKFKDNNLQLIQAKQEFEMERAHLNEKSNEFEEYAKDKKIQIEMYLHDERMKIEDEKRQNEFQLRTIPNQAHRKEVARFREEIDVLNIKLKQKENEHASSQARFRVQIRNFEKDQKILHEQIENLTKENKRLQIENAKMLRDDNSKMLKEINRNIVKLVPKLTSIEQSKNGEILTRSNTNPDLKKSSNTKIVDNDSKSQGTSKSLHRNLNKFTLPNKISKNKRHVFNDCEEDDETNNDNDDIEYSFTNMKESDTNNNDSACTCPISQNNCNSDAENHANNNSKTSIKQSHSISKQISEENKDPKCTCKTNIEKDSSQEFCRKIINTDGSTDYIYANGNVKKVSANGMVNRMLYFNKDVKETDFNDGTERYYYAETNTWHTTYIDGREILEFPNGHHEHRYENGIIETHYPDNSVRKINPNDENKSEEWEYSNGTKVIKMRSGDLIMAFPNGQREVHTQFHKRREYPDGTLKIVYPDGSQETHYSDGRVRMKDKDGKVLMG